MCAQVLELDGRTQIHTYIVSEPIILLTMYAVHLHIRLFKLAYKLLPLAFIIWLRLEETEVTETHGRAITMVRHVSKDLA